MACSLLLAAASENAPFSMDSLVQCTHSKQSGQAPYGDHFKGLCFSLLRQWALIGKLIILSGHEVVLIGASGTGRCQWTRTATV